MSELHVDSVFKSFGTNQILTDIFISCKPGEIIGLLGRNGTGKSTLLKIIFGALKSERKFIRINGTIVNNLFESRNLVSYLPQDNFLPNHLNIKNIISLFCNNSDKETLLNNKFIKPFVNRKSRELSGGEKRLIEIFLIVNSSAKYILIDEPFNGVAPFYKDDIKTLIREYSQKKGFIITDHDYRNIIDVTTRNILLYDGGIKEIKNIDELKYWGYIPNLK